MNKSEHIRYELAPYFYLATGLWAIANLDSAAKVFGVLMLIPALLIIVMRMSHRKKVRETVKRRIATKKYS